MVGSRHSSSNEDGFQVLSRPSLDHSRRSFEDAGPEERLLNEDEPATNIIAFHPGAPEFDTGAAVADTRRSRTWRPKNAAEPKEPVSWKDLPQKDQLLVIMLARLSEPLTQTSLQSYMFYQLQWFDPRLPDSTISSQAGILHASFTAAQFLTAMIWGRLSDSRYFGRKTVIMIGLFGTLISCAGFGFSTSFYQALVFRSLGGITNGNVGVMRTMISETIREKKYQSRAFLILPMTFNIGVIIGPILGGLLSDPAGSYPDLFGGVDFFKRFPYATPNIVSALFLLLSLTMCWLLLEETLDSRKGKRDIGILLGRRLKSLCRRRRERIAYTPLHSRGTSLGSTVSTTDLELSPAAARGAGELAPKKARSGKRYINRLPWKRIFTRNVIFTLISHFFLAFHVGTFNSLWFVFLSTPVYDPSKPRPPDFQPRLPFRFTGGLGMPPRSVGLAMAVLGVIGILMQLFLYPRLSARLGTSRSLRTFLFCFPITYLLLPYLSIVPSTTPPPSQKTGVLIWIAVTIVLLGQVTGRTFALPATTILINNCTPHPSVLGTVHGIGQSTSSFARTVGPTLGGFLYGQGLSHGVVGSVFWGLAGVAAVGVIFSFWLREGDGHEIWLEGDEEDEV